MWYNEIKNAIAECAYIVREVRSLRPRERQRERERRKRRHLGSAEIGDEFALFLAKNSHVSSSPFKWR